MLRDTFPILSYGIHVKVEREGGLGCEGGGGVKRKGIWQSQKLWEAECAESISAITFLSDYSPRRGRKKAFEGEEGGCAVEASLSSSELPLCYNTSNNSAFTHSQLQISPLGCRLPVALLWAGRGCMYVCVCKPIRVGRWEGTFPGWETAVLS